MILLFPLDKCGELKSISFPLPRREKIMHTSVPLFIQYKSLEIVCNPDVIILTLFDIEVKYKDPKLV